MAINLTPRRKRIIVNGLDLSNEFTGTGSLTRSKWDEKPGLLVINGSLEFLYLPGITPESLDDRVNLERFARGSVVTIETLNSAGVYQPHPLGFLRLEDAEYNESTMILRLTLVDIIGYTADQTNQDDSTKTGIRPPQGRSFTAIANSLIDEMLGVPPLAFLSNYTINWNIDASNYWSTIGDLAYSAGKAIYVRFDESLGVVDIPTAGNAVRTYTLGTDESQFERLAGAELPPQKVKVVGQKETVESATIDNTTTSYGYGPGTSVGLDNASIILVEKEVRTESLRGNTKTITVDRDAAIGSFAIYPEGELSSLGTLVPASRRTEKYYYEAEADVDNDDDGSKLRSVLITELAARGIAHKDYISYLVDNDPDGNWLERNVPLLDHERTTIDYSYNTEAQTVQIDAVTNRPIQSFAGKDAPWGTSAIPTDLVKASQTVQEWFEKVGGKYWSASIKEYKALAIVGGLPAGASLSLRAATVLANQRIESGLDVRPPSPDRKPPAYSQESEQKEHELFMPMRGTSGTIKARTETIEVPFYINQYQAERIGRIHCTWAIGRFKGARFFIAPADEQYSYTPLEVIDIIHFDGARRTYVTDGEHHEFSLTSDVVGFDLVWLGDRGVATVPVRDPDTGEPTGETETLIVPPYQVNAPVGTTDIWLDMIAGQISQLQPGEVLAEEGTTDIWLDMIADPVVVSRILDFSTISGTGAVNAFVLDPQSASSNLNTVTGTGVANAANIIQGTPLSINTITGAGVVNLVALDPQPVTLPLNTTSGAGAVNAISVASITTVSLNTITGAGVANLVALDPQSVAVPLTTASGAGAVNPITLDPQSTTLPLNTASGAGTINAVNIINGLIDLSDFAALPAAEEDAVRDAAEAAASGQGYDGQSVIDVITSGQIWINTPNSLYSNTAATTLIAGVAGNPVQAWKDWCDSENFIEGTTPPTYQTDGVSFTAATNTKLDLTSAKSYGAQNNRTFIFLANFTTGSNQDFFGNRVAGSNDAWILRKNPGTADVLYATIGRDTSTFSVANGSLLFLRTKLSTNSTTLNVFVNGSNTFNDTTITAAAANPDPQVLRLGRQNSTSQDATFKLRALFAYSGTLSDADAAKVERFINAYFGLSLL